MNYFKGVITELKQVTLPTPKQTLKMSGVVLFVLIVSTLIIWGLDVGLSSALGWFLGK